MKETRLHAPPPLKFIGEVPYVFVRVPKTASTSIMRGLHRRFRHRTALSWREEAGEKIWEELFTFAIVRHPYDRFLSMFYFFYEYWDENLKDPNQYLKVADLNKMHEAIDRRFNATQTDYICDEKGNVLIDYVGRFETLQDSWGHIKKKIGVTKQLPHMRKGKRTKAELTSESKEILYDFFQKDFEIFGYNKD